MDKANNRYLVVGIIITMIIAVVGVTYAYWRGQIQGEGANMSVTLDKVYIQFTDSTEISETGVRPGWSTSKSFTVENQGSTEFKYDIYIKDLINTLVTEGYFQYKITSNNNGYNMDEYAPIAKSLEASDFDLGTGITIDAGVKQTYTIEFRYVDDPDVDQSEDMGKKFSGVLAIRENNRMTLYSVLSDGNKYTLGERGTFDKAWGASSESADATITQGYNQTGTIYKTGNDYYFAGNPSDNWVYFADKWWRIIRTNSTEGTRLLYAGTTHDGQDGYINNRKYQWYNSYSNKDYVQWSYAQDTIGIALTDWYDTNITDQNLNMINDNVVYCNDISSSKGSQRIYYGAYTRLLEITKNPSYECLLNGNDLHKSIGLMTADELVFAGGRHGKNSPNTYYARNSKTNGCTGKSGDPCSVVGDNGWWTISPYHFNESLSSAAIFGVYGAADSGRIGFYDLNYSQAIRPVITLKPEVIISGSGTTDDPYVPSL